MSSVVVSVVGVSRTVHQRGNHTTLLAPVSVDLRPGTLVAVSGASGSGKTTLCNIIVGWEESDTGGLHWSDGGVQAWARLAVAPQRLALVPSLTIRENLALPFWSSGIDEPQAELDELAGALDLTPLLRRRPSEVSFGEQQRAAVARALLGSPRLAVLDEPTGHQDEARTALVVDALLAATRRGTCVLVATHDADVIAAADQVLALRKPSVAPL